MNASSFSPAHELAVIGMTDRLRGTRSRSRCADQPDLRAQSMSAKKPMAAHSA
jgi:hypothetical protein